MRGLRLTFVLALAATAGLLGLFCLRARLFFPLTTIAASRLPVVMAASAATSTSDRIVHVLQNKGTIPSPPQVQIRKHVRVHPARRCNQTLADILPAPAFPGKERGLLLLGAGSKNYDLVEILVSHFLATRSFLVCLLAYEDFDWRGSFPSWANDVEIIRENGWKYSLVAKHFPADKLERMGISHIFMWDDDVELTPGFNASLFLRVLQSAPQIHVAAPAVGANCHLVCWAAQPPADLVTVHAVASTPEMMFPIYSTKAWRCYASLLNEQTPEMWGIDSSAAGCACRDTGSALSEYGQAIFVNQLVHHADRKGNRAKFNETRAHLAEAHIHRELRRRRPHDWQECLDKSTSMRVASDGVGAASPTFCLY